MAVSTIHSCPLCLVFYWWLWPGVLVSICSLDSLVKSGFAPCGDTRNANYWAGCREKVDNFNPTWSPHNKVRRSLKSGWLEEIWWNFWRFMLIHAGILCCTGVQINIQTFCVETFRIASRPLWNLALSPSGHLLSEYMLYIGFAVVLVIPTLMSENTEISDHGIFSGVQALPIDHIWGEIIALLKLILKFRTVIFYPNRNF